MRKLILISPLFISCITLYSQPDSLLKTFKFRNANYRAITYFFNGGGQFVNTGYVLGDAKEIVGSGAIGATYQQTKSTDRILFTMNGGLSMSFGKAKAESATNEYTNRQLSFVPFVSVNNKWFSKNWFTELGLTGYGNFFSGKSTDENTNVEQKQQQGYQTLELTAGFGKGRLENITDMQNALWLNKVLEQEGRLSRPLTAAELNNLGRAITAGNNTRILDARKRTQFILETIDNYLQQNGLISKTDIKYFTNLNDIVFFAINDPRLSGTEKFIRITPGIENYDVTFKQQPLDSRDEEESFNYSALLSIGFNKYLPQSLKHQNDFGVAAQLKYLHSDYSNVQFVANNQVNGFEMEATLRQAGLTGFFQHSIYPNTRTLIRFKLDAMGGYQDIDDESTFYTMETLSAGWDYFISYRTRVAVNLGASYQNNIYVLDKHLNWLPERLQLFANAAVYVSL